MGVVLWQFCTVGVSALILMGYVHFEMGQGDLQPISLMYLINLLTFPMNVISWSISGFRNGWRAIHELEEYLGEGNERDSSKGQE